ncbi:acyltransferase family protein [Aestuariivivens insulae]|uniref:acyltransferase family protein n=1 Tax=Aestuariivivens insulae TaxID=1621988 RepID=UPI001F57C925|nr:acyltransferase [Aestuariivivens insulae]
MSSTYSNKTNRIFGLDVMRAIAIAMVVLSHTTYIFQGYHLQVVQLMGIQGVELFFVLSGFLIGGILMRLFNATYFSRTTLVYFWVRRWFRTLPLYFLMLVVNILIAVVVGYGLPDSLWKYVFFLQNFNKSHIPFFPESWSLSVEEYAYVLAPIGLYIASKLFKNRKEKDTLFLKTSIVLVLLFFVSKCYYYLSTIDVEQSVSLWNSNLKAIVVYRLDAILYGFILVYYFNKYKTKIERLKEVLFFFGITLSFFVLMVMPLLGGTIEKLPFFWNVLLLPLNSIAICLMLPLFYFLNPPKKRLAEMIKRVSLYSYAMYLLHYTFVLYLMQLLLDFGSLNVLQRIISVLAYLIITYVLSKWVYIYFERPLTNLRDAFRIKQFFKTKIVKK